MNSALSVPPQWLFLLAGFAMVRNQLASPIARVAIAHEDTLREIGATNFQLRLAAWQAAA